MKPIFLPMLFAAALACTVQAHAQVGTAIINRYGPPSYTGGSVGSPAESSSFSYHQTPAEEGIPQASTSVFQFVGPNPSADEVHIVLAAPLLQPARISLVNMNGVLIMSQPFVAGSHDIYIDVSPFPEGLYALQLQEQGRVPEVVPFLKAAN